MLGDSREKDGLNQVDEDEKCFNMKGQIWFDKSNIWIFFGQFEYF